MTTKKKERGLTDHTATPPSLWRDEEAMETKPGENLFKAALLMQSWGGERSGLAGWLRTQLGWLAGAYPEIFRGQKGKRRGVSTFLLSSAPSDDESACFGHWPSAGVVFDGVGIAIELPEHPRQVHGSCLIDVIEQGKVPERYFLSPHAAHGILRRCALMKRPLFPPPHRALELLAQKDGRELKD